MPPLVFSTNIALPMAKRRDSPSETVTSHSPLRTMKKVRAGEVCQLLDQPAGASINLTPLAAVRSERFKAGAAPAKFTGAKPISISSKCESPAASENSRVKVNMIQDEC